MTHTALPWAYESGAVYSGKTRVLLADRETPGTTPAERDSNLKLAAVAVNNHAALVDLLHDWAAWHYQRYGSTVTAGAPLAETAAILAKVAG